MLGHLGINVPDLAAARAYYGSLLPLVGMEPFLDHDDEFAYRAGAGKPGTYLFFYPAAEPGAVSRHRPGLQHLAFMVGTRSLVHSAHEHALAAGLPVLHPPQVFPQYPQPYFATFWSDPFGFMLEVVCHHDRE
jgi:catechol 2,3-dioxygenase-like lactoylglutathione lyase family enzyme